MIGRVPKKSSTLRRPTRDFSLRRWIAPGAGLLLTLYVTYWCYRFLVSRLGALAPLVFVIGALPVLVGIVVWVWHRYGSVIMRHAEGAMGWTRTRTKRSDWYRTTHARYPALFRFSTDRLEPHGAAGLGLSVVVVSAAAALWAFAELLVEVVSGSPITTVDHRIINLFQMLRTPAADRLMLGATYIGSGQGVAVIAGAAVLIAILLRRWRDALMITASLAAGSAFFSIAKLIIRRPRPPLYDARIVQGGFSFPSGHATMAAVLYATFAVILIRSFRSFWLRLPIALCATIAVLWIGLSRVYLGVHYPSDVLAGWAAGVLWALVTLAVSRLWQSKNTATPEATHAVATDSVGRMKWPRLAAVGIVLLASITYLGTAWPSVPPERPKPKATLSAITDAQLIPVLHTRVPRYTVGLFGHRQEPINVIFIGSASDVVRAFRAADWVQADRLSLLSLRRALSAALTGGPDPTGPVTPSFLGEQPELLAFSQAAGHTFATRHHIRIWLSSYELTSGSSVWLATTSYDSGYAISAGSFLPVHEIAPDIDDEREYVVASLMRGLTHAILVADTTRIQLVPPEIGTNAFGQPFFTYGQAVVMQFAAMPAHQ